METIKINKVQTANNTYFEAVFNGGNLFCFSLAELCKQLKDIYNIEFPFFNLNLN